MAGRTMGTLIVGRRARCHGDGQDQRENRSARLGEQDIEDSGVAPGDTAEATGPGPCPGPCGDTVWQGLLCALGTPCKLMTMACPLSGVASLCQAESPTHLL